MFYGYNFIFDNVPSEKYGLKIGFLGSSGASDSYSGVSQTIEEQKLRRVDKPFFYGVETAGKIQFDLLLYSDTEIDTYDRQAIDRWLFKKTYKYFQIEQRDYNGLFFNAIIQSGVKVDIGNVPYAKRITIVCDSPYVYTDEYIYSYSSPSIVNLNNLSNINDYTYTDMVITMGIGGGTCTITNNAEGRVFQITGLSANEVLTIDNEMGILSSSTSNARLSNFNKNWFRLMPENNNLTLTGDFSLVIRTRFRMTI